MLEQFATELLKEKGLDKVDATVHFGLVTEIADKAAQLINKRVLDSMSDEQLQDFSKLVDKNANPDEVNDFMKKNVPDKDRIAAEALLEFRSLYLGANQGK